jgi:hypothetical protein
MASRISHFPSTVKPEYDVNVGYIYILGEENTMGKLTVLCSGLAKITGQKILLQLLQMLIQDIKNQWALTDQSSSIIFFVQDG